MVNCVKNWDDGMSKELADKKNSWLEKRLLVDDLVNSGKTIVKIKNI